jgi:hypothetical protein
MLAQQPDRQFVRPGSKNSKYEDPNQGNWYFNNTPTLSFGYTDLWEMGTIKLEDLWSLSKKQSMDFELDNNLAENTEFSDEDSLQEAL